MLEWKEEGYMILAVDFLSEMPIYMQIYEQIVMAISTGELAPGESLPSVRRLSEDIGVNIHTVNKTYAILRDDGYIHMTRRSGAEVATRMPDKSVLLQSLTGRLRQLAAQASVHGIGEEEFLLYARTSYREAISKENEDVL